MEERKTEQALGKKGTSEIDRAITVKPCDTETMAISASF